MPCRAMPWHSTFQFHAPLAGSTAAGPTAAGPAAAGPAAAIIPAAAPRHDGTRIQLKEEGGQQNESRQNLQPIRPREVRVESRTTNVNKRDALSGFSRIFPTSTKTEFQDSNSLRQKPLFSPHPLPAASAAAVFASIPLDLSASPMSNLAPSSP